MTLVTRARAAGILAISLLMLGAPGALASVPYHLPDAEIRPGSNPTYTGGGVFNTDATGQSVSNGGVVGDKLTFWIRIRNLGALTDSFKVRRSSGYNNGYRVRYYDAANNDVTGPVTKGTFTTPMVANLGEYVMRATVKVRSLATEGSFTSRLITVSSVANPNAKDTVRFTGELAWLSINFTGIVDGKETFNFTGGGLMPDAAATAFATLLEGGTTSTLQFTASSTGDLSAGGYTASCNTYQSITVMSLAANGSAVQDTATVPC